MKKILASFGDWIKIMVLATFLALLFKSCFFDVYTIPSTSMISSLRPGDVIVVNKLRYGPKLFRTILTIPFLHKHIPFTDGMRCYFDVIQLPYYRFPGYAEIQRNDLLVFHYPSDDLFPVDHRTFYIKRCMALPGETIKIENDLVYVNDSVLSNSEELSYQYRIKSKKDLSNLADSLDIIEGGSTSEEGIWELTMDEKTRGTLQGIMGQDQVQRIALKPSDKDENIFAGDEVFNRNAAFFGPLYVPRAGDTIALNEDNLKYYERIIEVYEGHQLSVSPEKEVFIDKSPATYYVPAMNYYFVLGDNRYNSSDSRYWGFVPEDHIQGRASLVLYSIKSTGEDFGKLDWRRLMKWLH